MTDKEGYRVIEQLGTGLAGPVFLAESEAGKVVIRHFQPHSPSGTEQAAYERLRFVQSARRASALKQTGIVGVLEVLDEGQDSFCAAEYVPHKTLKEALERQTFSTDQSTRLIRRIALTLHYANQNGVVHGDFKPSNVFLLPQDEVKVSDFAVSPRAWPDPKVLPPEWSHAYLAPEFYSDRDRVGPRSDQYALAATAYHLYTHKLPYRLPIEGSGERSALAPVSRISPQVPKATDAVLGRAMSDDPNDRFGSCLEFAEALVASFELCAPIVARAKRERSLVPILAAIACALLIAMAIFFFWPKHESPPLTARQSQPAAKPIVPAPAVKIPVPTPTPTPSAAVAVKRPNLRTSEPTKPAALPVSPPVERRKPVETAVLKPTPVPRVIPDRKPVPEVVPPAAALAEASKEMNLEIYSRDRKVEPGVTFSAKDWVIGEMGQGDLKAVVRGRPAKGKLTLDWYVDDIRMDTKEVVPNKVVAYGNEPTTGSYRVVLRQNSKEVSRFTFRITQ